MDIFTRFLDILVAALDPSTQDQKELLEKDPPGYFLFLEQFVLNLTAFLCLPSQNFLSNQWRFVLDLKETSV